MNFVQENAINFQDLKEYFEIYLNIYQYIYYTLFPVFSVCFQSVVNQGRGIGIQAFYQLHFREWADKKSKKNPRKNLAVYTEREEINELEQKAIEIDYFKNEEKDKAAEERLNKRKKYNEKAKLEKVELERRKNGEKENELEASNSISFSAIFLFFASAFSRLQVLNAKYEKLKESERKLQEKQF